MSNVIPFPPCNEPIARELPAAASCSAPDPGSNVVPFPADRSPAVFCFPTPGDLSPKELSHQVWKAAKLAHFGELVSIGTSRRGDAVIVSSSVEPERLADLLDMARECVLSLLNGEDLMA